MFGSYYLNVEIETSTEEINVKNLDLKEVLDTYFFIDSFKTKNGIIISKKTYNRLKYVLKKDGKRRLTMKTSQAFKCLQILDDSQVLDRAIIGSFV